MVSEFFKRNLWRLIAVALSGAMFFGATKESLTTLETNVATHSQQIQQLQVGEAADHQLILDIKSNVDEIHDDVKALLSARKPEGAHCEAKRCNKKGQ